MRMRVLWTYFFSEIFRAGPKKRTKKHKMFKSVVDRICVNLATLWHRFDGISDMKKSVRNNEISEKCEITLNNVDGIFFG